MRNLLKLFAVILLFGTTATINAQTLKFGHIDMQALIPIMPEAANAQTELDKFNADMQEIYDGMIAEYERKVTELEALGEDASEVKRNAKFAEVQDASQKVENFRATVNQQVQQKNAEILQPIYEKAQTTVEEVAKEQGLIYVFDSSIGAILYKSNQSVDLLPLVKQKLGIE